MMAPGDGSDHVQNIDVRDLVEFQLRLVEDRTYGVFQRGRARRRPAVPPLPRAHPHRRRGQRRVHLGRRRLPARARPATVRSRAARVPADARQHRRLRPLRPVARDRGRLDVPPDRDHRPRHDGLVAHAAGRAHHRDQDRAVGRARSANCWRHGTRARPADRGPGRSLAAGLRWRRLLPAPCSPCCASHARTPIRRPPRPRPARPDHRRHRAGPTRRLGAVRTRSPRPVAGRVERRHRHPRARSSARVCRWPTGARTACRKARRHADAALQRWPELLGLRDSEFRERIGARMGRTWTFQYDQWFPRPAGDRRPRRRAHPHDRPPVLPRQHRVAAAERLRHRAEDRRSHPPRRARGCGSAASRTRCRSRAGPPPIDWCCGAMPARPHRRCRRSHGKCRCAPSTPPVRARSAASTSMPAPAPSCTSPTTSTSAACRAAASPRPGHPLRCRPPTR